MLVDAFAVLGLEYGPVDQAVLAGRMRELAKQHHPDKSPDNPTLFGELTGVAALLRDDDYVSTMAGAVEQAKIELARAGGAPAGGAGKRLRDRVREVLFEIDFARRPRPGADDAAAPDQQQPSPAKTTRNRHGEARRRRKRGLGGGGGDGGHFRRPADPTAPTEWLFVANTGPRLGVSAAELQHELGQRGTGVVEVVAPSPTAAFVYARFPSPQAAAVAKQRFDRRCGACLEGA